MSVLADIKKLEEFVQSLIVSAPGAAYFEQFSNTFQASVLASLQDAEPSDFNRFNFDQIIQDALDEAIPVIKESAKKDIADRLLKSLEATSDFYQKQGTETPDLAKLLTASPVAVQVYELLLDSIDAMSEKLRDATIELAKEAALNNQGRAWLEDELMLRTDVKLWAARVNAKLVVSALNQITRNDLANLAGIQHFYYYGLSSDNTRPFCNYHLGKVYTREQIEKMNNGMLNPVFIFKGGYNCKHTWLPVEVSWDPSLKRAFDANRTPQSEPLNEVSKKQITVLP